MEKKKKSPTLCQYADVHEKNKYLEGELLLLLE